MEKFISYEGFQIRYDQEKIRAEREDGSGFIEFSMHNLDYLIEGENINMWEIDKLYDLLKDNEDIIKARLRGEWVEMEEDETDRME